MAIRSSTVYTCDVPSCQVTHEEDGLPPGWSEISCTPILRSRRGCNCDCHTCDAGDEMEVAGHEEEDCQCVSNPEEWEIIVCPSHTQELARRLR